MSGSKDWNNLDEGPNKQPSKSGGKKNLQELMRKRYARASSAASSSSSDNPSPVQTPKPGSGASGAFKPVQKSKAKSSTWVRSDGAHAHRVLDSNGNIVDGYHNQSQGQGEMKRVSTQRSRPSDEPLDEALNMVLGEINKEGKSAMGKNPAAGANGQGSAGGAMAGAAYGVGGSHSGSFRGVPASGGSRNQRGAYGQSRNSPGRPVQSTVEPKNNPFAKLEEFSRNRNIDEDNGDDSQPADMMGKGLFEGGDLMTAMLGQGKGGGLDQMMDLMRGGGMGHAQKGAQTRRQNESNDAMNTLTGLIAAKKKNRNEEEEEEEEKKPRRDNDIVQLDEMMGRHGGRGGFGGLEQMLGAMGGGMGQQGGGMAEMFGAGGQGGEGGGGGYGEKGLAGLLGASRGQAGGRGGNVGGGGEKGLAELLGGGMGQARGGGRGRAGGGRGGRGGGMVPFGAAMGQPGMGRGGRGMEGMMDGDIDPENASKQDVVHQMLAYEKMKAVNCRDPRSDGMCTLIIVDISGSMVGEPILEAVQFICHFINGLEEVQFEFGLNENVALAVCGSEVQVLQHLTHNYPIVRHAVDTIIPEGASRLDLGLFLPMAAFSPNIHQNRRDCVAETNGHHVVPRVILISDGFPSMTPDGQQRMSEEDALLLQNMCVEHTQQLVGQLLYKLYCVPVGEANTNFLDMVSSSTGGGIIRATEAKRASRCYLHHYLVGQLSRDGVNISSRAAVAEAVKHVVDLSEETDVDSVMEIIAQGEPDLASRDAQMTQEAQQLQALTAMQQQGLKPGSGGIPGEMFGNMPAFGRGGARGGGRAEDRGQLGMEQMMAAMQGGAGGEGMAQMMSALQGGADGEGMAQMMSALQGGAGGEGMAQMMSALQGGEGGEGMAEMMSALQGGADGEGMAEMMSALQGGAGGEGMAQMMSALQGGAGGEGLAQMMSALQGGEGMAQMMSALQGGAGGEGMAQMLSALQGGDRGQNMARVMSGLQGGAGGQGMAQMMAALQGGAGGQGIPPEMAGKQVGACGEGLAQKMDALQGSVRKSNSDRMEGEQDGAGDNGMAEVMATLQSGAGAESMAQMMGNLGGEEEMRKMMASLGENSTGGSGNIYRGALRGMGGRGRGGLGMVGRNQREIPANPFSKMQQQKGNEATQQNAAQVKSKEQSSGAVSVNDPKQKTTKCPQEKHTFGGMDGDDNEESAIETNDPLTHKRQSVEGREGFKASKKSEYQSTYPVTQVRQQFAGMGGITGSAGGNQAGMNSSRDQSVRSAGRGGVSGLSGNRATVTEQTDQIGQQLSGMGGGRGGDKNRGRSVMPNDPMAQVRFSFTAGRSRVGGARNMNEQGENITLMNDVETPDVPQVDALEELQQVTAVQGDVEKDPFAAFAERQKKLHNASGNQEQTSRDGNPCKQKANSGEPVGAIGGMGGMGEACAMHDSQGSASGMELFGGMGGPLQDDEENQDEWLRKMRENNRRGEKKSDMQTVLTQMSGYGKSKERREKRKLEEAKRNYGCGEENKSVNTRPARTREENENEVLYAEGEEESMPMKDKPMTDEERLAMNRRLLGKYRSKHDNDLNLLVDNDLDDDSSLDDSSEDELVDSEGRKKTLTELLYGTDHSDAEEPDFSEEGMMNFIRQFEEEEGLGGNNENLGDNEQPVGQEVHPAAGGEGFQQLFGMRGNRQGNMAGFGGMGNVLGLGGMDRMGGVENGVNDQNARNQLNDLLGGLGGHNVEGIGGRGIDGIGNIGNIGMGGLGNAGMGGMGNFGLGGMRNGGMGGLGNGGMGIGGLGGMGNFGMGRMGNARMENFVVENDGFGGMGNGDMGEMGNDEMGGMGNGGFGGMG